MVNDRGKFILNLLPSGILREDVVNVMGNGMVVDLEHLNGEMGRLAEAGVTISPQRLKISNRAGDLHALPCAAGQAGGGPPAGRQVRLHPAGIALVQATST